MKRRKTYHKATLRSLARIAHERELKKNLSELALKFEDWKSGKVGSFQMEQFLHQYDCDESRKLWSVYNSTHLRSVVARAIAIGLLSEREVPKPIMKELGEEIAFFRDGNHTARRLTSRTS